MSHSSTAAAQARPSAMAHTMRLWPRPMSPHDEHAVDVRHPVGVAGDVAALVELDAELLEQAVRARGPTKPIARSTSSHGSSKSVPSTFSNSAAVDDLLLDLVGPQRPHVAVVVAEEALGVDREDPLAALLVRATTMR